MQTDLEAAEVRAAPALIHTKSVLHPSPSLGLEVGGCRRSPQGALQKWVACLFSGAVLGVTAEELRERRGRIYWLEEGEEPQIN